MSFAAPVTVSTVTSLKELDEQDNTVPEEAEVNSEDAKALRRHRNIFSYKTSIVATTAGIDTFDIDKLEMLTKFLS